MQYKEEKQEVSYLTNRTGEHIPISSVLDAIVRKLGDKEAMENSKAKYLVTNFIEQLTTRRDPFTTSLLTIGGETSLNSLGVLLFVAFQFGYTFALDGYDLDISQFTEQIPDPEEPNLDI
jgi:hypothetical protein